MTNDQCPSGRWAVLGVLLLCVAVAFGQTYKLPWNSFNSGGAPGTSTSYGTNGSAGQPVQGLGTSTSFDGYWGFWYGFPMGAPPAVDVECRQIDAPGTRVAINTEVKAKATYRNNGSAAVSFTAYCFLEDPSHVRVHSPFQPVTGLEPGNSTTVEFTGYNVGAVLGDWAVKCSAYVFGDGIPGNNSKQKAFEVLEQVWPEGWVEVRSVPKTPTDKAVKDGAWLAAAPGGVAGCRFQVPGSGPLDPRPLDPLNPVLYVAKGYKATDFYAYDPMEGDSGAWYDRAEIPDQEDGRTKPPSKGCVGVSDGSQYLYMTKGNNTLGFWRYDAVANQWDSMTGAGVPLGKYRKKVKGGTDAVYAMYRDTGCVYLLKGYKTEFYRYNTLAGRWDTLGEVPYGANKQKYDKGSFLGYDETNKLIYAHQAKYYDKTQESPNHYMFKYDVAADSWYHAPLSGLPVYQLEGGREHKKKKSADGAAGAWFGTNLYALKGGNTQGFFKYFPVGDTWTQLDTVPGNGTFGKKKRVKAGGDLVSYGGGAFFALKGNKTYEVWRYMEGTTAFGSRPMVDRTGAMAGKTAVGGLQFAVSPNPIAGGFATLRIQGVKESRGRVADLRIFDVMGRCVLVRQLVTGNCNLAIPLDLRKLSAGVYLVRLDAEGATQTQKLVVQR